MSNSIADFKGSGLYQFDNEKTRRKFLRVLTTAGTGLVGIQKATERVFGEKPEGKPIVWRCDKYGNPQTVRYIPKERYRRIKVYEELHPKVIYSRTEGVNGITLSQESNDPTDLVLKVYVDNNTRAVRRALPNRIQKVPIVVEEREVNPKWASVCERRIDDFYDPLPANPAIWTRDANGDAIDTGTLGIVCWNSNSNNPYKCYITAAHVAEDGGSYGGYLRQYGQDSNGNYLSEDVGDYVDHSPSGKYGLDVIKYRRRSGTVPAYVGGNADSRLGDLMGTWTHSGLTDRTSGSQSLPVKFAGRSTCYATTDCISTSKNASVEFQANYSPNELTHGDSGGPFLDSDDYLVGTFSYFNPSTSHGPTGQEILDRLDIQLRNPQINDD